jgi:hypothetical protein
VGNNSPTLFPSLVQRGSDQSSGHTSPAKSARDMRVVQDDAGAPVRVTKEGEDAGCAALDAPEQE